MSYESVKLALSPVAWYRNDEVSGTQMTDASINALHQTYQNLDGTVVLGQPTGVETVPTSFSVYGEQQIASIAVTPAGPFDSKVTFTWEVLVRPSAGGPARIIARHHAFANSISLLGGANLAFHFDLLIGGNNYRVSSPENVLLGSWYHIIAVRNGPTQFIMVNGAVVGQRTNLPPTDPIQEGSPDVIALHAAGQPFFGNSEEYTFYNYALTPAQGTAIYEEIVASLNMQGRADIRFSAVLDGSVEPDPVAYPFRHNWSEPVVERLSWRTARLEPVDGVIDTTRHRSGLRRQVEYSHLLMDERLRRQFEARSFGGRKALIQFEPDKVQMPVASGATSASFDTRYRDFEVGQYALFYESDVKYEHQLLTVVTDSGIEWADPLVNSYSGLIKPARNARLQPQQTVELHTDTIGEASVIYDYLPEDEPLSPRRIKPWVPTLSYEDGEVFDLAVWRGHDWSELPEIEFTSARDVLDNGVGIVSDKQYPSGAEVVSPYRLLLDTRESIARYLGWLYARAGQHVAFWMPTFRQDLEPLAGEGTLSLRVSGHEYTDLYADSDSRRDLAFIYFDNTYTLRRITGATQSGNGDILTLDGLVPSFASLRWLSFLRRVTLASDDLELAWHTDSVVVAAFAVRDAPSGAEMASASPSPSRSPSPSASVSPSVSPSQSPSASLSASVSPSRSPSASLSPSASSSRSPSPSASQSPSGSLSPSSSTSPSQSPSSSPSPSV